MSFQAMTWAVRQKVGNATGKAILLMLANYADKDGYCMPGQRTLAAECECSERTVRDWLAKFDEMGLTKRDERRRDDGYRTSDAIVLQLASPENAAAEISPAGNSPENASPENPSDLTGSTCRAINGTSQGNRKGSSSAREIDALFDQFWPVYPHKVGKPVARKSFEKALRFADFPTIMAGLRAYVAKTDDRPWCNPATWLNQQRWADQPAVQQPRGSPRQPRPSTRDIFMSTLETDDGQDREDSSNRRDWDDAPGVPVLTIEHQRR